MEVVAIKGQIRNDLGKKGTKAIRKSNGIPCVIYGGDKTVHFSTKFNEVKNLVYTPDFKLANVTVDSGSYKCIVKDIQFHPVTDEIQHLDFLQLVEGNSVKIDVPVRFEGTSPGLKVGGALVQKMRRVKLKTTPENLIDQVVLDISKLELGDSVRVKDIKVMEGVEVMNPPGNPIASIEIPRALRSAEAEESEEEGGDGEEAAEAGTEE